MKTYNEDRIPEEIDGINVIQDLTIAMDCLSHGETIARYEFGDSMSPILISGQFCKLIPIKEGDEIKQGDCVFAEVGLMVGTHMVWMISESNEKKYYCIATTSGRIIGWTDKIIAKAVGIPHVVNAPKLSTKLSAKSISIGGIGSLLNPTPSNEYGYGYTSRERFSPRMASSIDIDFENADIVSE